MKTGPRSPILLSDEEYRIALLNEITVRNRTLEALCYYSDLTAWQERSWRSGWRIWNVELGPAQRRPSKDTKNFPVRAEQAQQRTRPWSKDRECLHPTPMGHDIGHPTSLLSNTYCHPTIEACSPNSLLANYQLPLRPSPDILPCHKQQRRSATRRTPHTVVRAWTYLYTLNTCHPPKRMRCKTWCILPSSRKYTQTTRWIHSAWAMPAWPTRSPLTRVLWVDSITAALTGAMADRSDTIGLIRRLASRLPSSPGALSGAKWVYCACQLGAVRFGTLVAEVLPPDFCLLLGVKRWCPASYDRGYWHDVVKHTAYVCQMCFDGRRTRGLKWSTSNGREQHGGGGDGGGMRKGGQTCEASMIAGDSTVCFAEFERLYWWVALVQERRTIACIVADVSWSIQHLGLEPKVLCMIRHAGCGDTEHHCNLAALGSIYS